MARAVQKTAAKDYPAQGISKGDKYWFAEVMTGPRSSRTIRSKNPIPRSQLTSSAFLSTAYDLSDRLSAGVSSKDDLESIRSEFESLKDDTQNSLDAMPEGLQQGQTGQDLQERIDQLDSLDEELGSAIDAVAELESNDLWEHLTDEKQAELIGEAIPEFNNLF